jgi:alpha-D-ribose 1-methylphosphonate 5-triphosphate synthase subunit PhnG
MEPDIRLEKADAHLSPLPNLVTVPDGYRVYHPDGPTPGAVLDAVDDIENESAPLRAALVLVASLAGATGLPFLVGSGEFWPIVASILAGSAGGVLVAWVPAAMVERRTREDRWRRGGATVVHRVVRGTDVRAARLCGLADDIAETVSWRDGLIDPDRQVPATLWAAVERAARLSKLETLLRESEARGVPDCPSETLRRDVAALRAELARIEANLAEISGIAHELDDTLAGRAAAGGAVDHSGDILAHGRALRELLQGRPRDRT